MLGSIYSFNRIAGAVILLVAASWLAYAHDSDGDGTAGIPQTAQESGAVVRSSRLLMGTAFKLSVWAPAGCESKAAEAIQQALDRVASLESRISSWKSDSETTVVNQSAGERAVPISRELHDLIDVSLSWTRRTEGAFDITAGPLFQRWKRARQEGILPTDEEILRCLERIGHEDVMLQHRAVRFAKPAMQIGFGAIGKGYAADRAAAQLRELGFDNFIIDAGGDVVVSGARGDTPWQVAIRHPRRRGFLAVYGARDRAIATSGDYEQFSVIDDTRYAHILDPRTGWPARDVASVTVITQRGVDADAMATALFVMGSEKGMTFVEGMRGTDALMVLQDGSNRLSKGLRLHNGRLKVVPAPPTLAGDNEQKRFAR